MHGVDGRFTRITLFSMPVCLSRPKMSCLLFLNKNHGAFETHAPKHVVERMWLLFSCGRGSTSAHASHIHRTRWVASIWTMAHTKLIWNKQSDDLIMDMNNLVLLLSRLSTCNLYPLENKWKPFILYLSAVHGVHCVWVTNNGWKQSTNITEKKNRLRCQCLSMNERFWNLDFGLMGIPLNVQSEWFEFTCYFNLIQNEMKMLPCEGRLRLIDRSIINVRWWNKYSIHYRPSIS